MLAIWGFYGALAIWGLWQFLFFGWDSLNNNEQYKQCESCVYGAMLRPHCGPESKRAITESNCPLMCAFFDLCVGGFCCFLRSGRPAMRPSGLGVRGHTSFNCRTAGVLLASRADGKVWPGDSHRRTVHAFREFCFFWIGEL